MLNDLFGIEISTAEWGAAGLWAGGVGVAALIGVALHVIIFFILRRVTKRTEGETDTSIVNRISGAAWLLLPTVAALIVAQPKDAMPIVGMARHMIVILMIIAVAWMLHALTYVLNDIVRAKYDMSVKDNLHARKIYTKISVFRKIATVLIVILAAAAILMTFPTARQLGAGILASAGIAGIVVGIAARPTLSNLLAGLQIALTETLTLDDVVVIKGEWGRIEEITSTYVVVRIWDLRRLVIPIGWFVENPFENWTRKTADLLGTVFLHCDYRVPVEDVRAQLKRVLDESEHWDGESWGLQVTDSTDRTMSLRCLMSAPDSSAAWNLRCEVREKMIGWLQREHPDSLPRVRAEVEGIAFEEDAGEESGARGDDASE